jgi:hypothetical protein
VALLAGWPGALVLWVCYNAVHLTLRHAGVGWGYRQGPAVLSGALRMRLERAVEWLQLAGTVALGVLVAVLLLPGGQPPPVPVQALLAVGLVFGSLTSQRARPSPTVWCLAIGAVCIAAVWFR